MRIAPTAAFLLCVFGLLSFVVAPDIVAGHPVQRSASSPPAEPITLVGVLTEQYRQECTGHMQERWVDPRFEVGFVRLSPGQVELPRSLVGKLVQVEGVRTTRPQDPPQGNACPAYQMRSDWVVAKGGFRVLRSGSQASLQMAMVPRSVKPFGGLTVTRRGDKLQVSLVLPGRGAYPRVSLVTHYEGCYGKPGTVSRRHEVTARRGGQRVTASFPTWVPGPPGSDPAARRRRSGHSAYSVQVVAENGPVSFDLDLVLSRHAGIRVDCPKRGL